MIYRRLFHTRVSFASRYIVNLMPIIREVLCIVRVWIFSNSLNVRVSELCTKMYRYIFCFIQKKIVSLHYHLTITILCNWLGNNQKHISEQWH